MTAARAPERGADAGTAEPVRARPRAPGGRRRPSARARARARCAAAPGSISARRPCVLSVPETHGRFYALSLVDLWSNVFASVGARTTGAGAGAYVIAGPAWSGGPLPPGALLIRAPTRIVRIAGVDAGRRRRRLRRGARRAGRLRAEAARRGARGARRSPRGPRRARRPSRRSSRWTPGRSSPSSPGSMRDNPPRLEDRAIVERMRRVGLLLEGDLDWRRLGGDGAARGRASAPRAGSSASWRRPSRRPATPSGSGTSGSGSGSTAPTTSTERPPRAPAWRRGPAEDELPALAMTDAHGRRLSGRRRYVAHVPAAAACRRSTASGRS